MVHCKPVGSGETALKYLAPYIFRVALSNRRLVKLENDQVTFCYTEAASGQTKYCTLPALAFIHRFLQHVLPTGFMKVRYYGLFAPGRRKALPALRQQLSQVTPPPPQPTVAEATAGSPPPAEDVLRCPLCGEIMVLRQILSPTRLPP